VPLLPRPIRPASALVLLAALLAAAPATARTLKLATIVPDGSAWMTEMREAAETIEARTDGRVELKFYPGGVMGNDRTVLRKMRAGQLQGGAFTSGALAPLFPDVELYSLPLLFRSYDEVAYVRARVDGTLEKGLEAAGLVPLAISDTGFAYVMSKKPIRRVEDLAGTRTWVLEDDIMSETALELAGVSPVQLPLADVYTALQTGLIDTVAAPPMGTIAFQWHTKVDYLTDVPLMYLVGILAVDAKSFGKLSPADQAVVREVVGAAGRRLDAASRADEARAKEALREQGITFVEATSAAEVDRWRAIGREAIAKLRTLDRYDEATIDAILGHLADFRAGAPAAGGE
jgi:TRAP-type C4-dicarboxylate transport system substrate-binding protein